VLVCVCVCVCVCDTNFPETSSGSNWQIRFMHTKSLLLTDEARRCVIKLWQVEI